MWKAVTINGEPWPYMVSDQGNVRRVSGRLLKLQRKPNANGQVYLYAELWKDGRRRRTGVGRLVCEAWHGPPAPDDEADHIDSNPLNNTPGNLRWLPPELNGGRRRGLYGQYISTTVDEPVGVPRGPEDIF